MSSGLPHESVGGHVRPYPNSLRMAQALAEFVAPSVRYCGFEPRTVNGKLRKFPYSRLGEGVPSDIPSDALWPIGEVERIGCPFIGLPLNKEVPMAEPGRVLAALDADWKKSALPPDPRLTALLEHTKAANGLTATSHSGKGWHALLSVPEGTVAPRRGKIKVCEGQELEIFGLQDSPKKALMLAGVNLAGVEPLRVDDLQGFLAGFGFDAAPEPTDLAVPPRSPIAPALLERVRDALKEMPPDCGYDDWIAVGQCLHAGLGEPGFALWDTWSEKGKKYEGTADLRSHWRSFRADGGRSLGTLFRMAGLGSGESPQAQAQARNVLSMREFLHEPLEVSWVWQHILMRGWLYALVAVPGSGKTAISLYLSTMVALGRDVAGRRTTPGRVLYLCGENPHDVRVRLEAMLVHLGLDGEALGERIFFTRRPFSIDNPAERRRFEAEAMAHAPFDFLVIDTGPAHSSGDDENSNRQAHELAMAIRALMAPMGMPATLVAMHPIKEAKRENLLPRGGSAFTGSVDGVLCVWRASKGSPSELFPHQSKFRGRQFEPLYFNLTEMYHPTAVDNFGDRVPTVMAEPIHAPAVAVQAETIGPGVREALLRFFRDVEDAGDWCGTNPAPNGRNPFSARWATSGSHPSELKSLGEAGRRQAYQCVEALLKEGMLVRERRKTADWQRVREYPDAVWITGEGRESLAAAEAGGALGGLGG